MPIKIKERNLKLFHPRRNVTVVWVITMQERTVQIKLLSVMPVKTWTLQEGTQK